MTFQFKPAIREGVGLIIGLAGGTGSGKTYSAMRLASGISGGKPFAVIDTEAGRAKHYADQFKFDHGDLKAPFTPKAYTEAIMAADEAGYAVIVVDSISHIWAGDGGLLEWQEQEHERLGGKGSTKLLSWSKPKSAHKKFVSKLLQLRAHLILCFRAEPKIEMVQDSNGKMVITEKHSAAGYKGWMPVCEKTLPYELTTSFMMMADHPGVPLPIKLQEQHRGIFIKGQKIDEEAGKRIALWASGKPLAKEVPATKEKEETI
jgi:hypothetical protein